MTDENQLVEEVEVEATATDVPEDNYLQTEQQAADGQDTEQSEEGDEQAAEDTGAPHKSKGAERRIRQLTRKFRDSERDRLALLERLDSLEKRIGPVPAPARPQREEFASIEEYEDALFDWRDTSKAVSQSKAKPPAIDETQAETIEKFESELEELAPDAIDIVMETEWPCSKDMTDYIMSSDNRAALAHYLAVNKDIAGKIYKLSPIMAARELAKVEGSLSSNKKPGAAPPPPPAKTGKPGGSSTVNPEKMSTQQWVAQRRKQLEER